MGTAQDGQATAVLIDEVFGGAGADTALNRAELSAAYTVFGIILRRVSRLIQPFPALHRSSRAVRRTLLGGHPCGMLIGACDPML